MIRAGKGISPVAEYRGIALCESPGDKRAVWHGVEYKTDGKVWLIQRGPGESFSMVGFALEADVKDYLDSLHDPKAAFLSRDEVLALLRVDPTTVPRPCTRWDEAAQHFVKE